MAQKKEKAALVVQLLDLPEELLLATFSLLEVWELCALSSVCSRLHDLAADDSLWRPLGGTLCSSDEQEEGIEESNFKDEYIAWLREAIVRYRQGWNSLTVLESGVALLRLILLGDAGVGKTSLLTRYVLDSHSDCVSTYIGVDFKIKEVEVAGRSYKLQIWDTAGQERFRPFPRGYFRNCNGCLLVYDSTLEESVRNLSNWLAYIKENTPHVPVVLAGNKIDRHDVDQGVIHLAQQFAEENGGIQHFETSAKKDTNVTLAFMTLVESALRFAKKRPSKYPSATALEKMGIRFGDRKPTPPVALQQQTPNTNSSCYC